MSVKLLISGTENSGKTTAISNIKNALVVSIDNKKFPYQLAHVNISSYTTMEDFVDTINEKVIAYKEKYGKLPQTVVFDTVTSLYTQITKSSMSKYSGFNVHSHISKETLDFNDYIENTLLDNNINVVIVAHSMWDSDTGRWYIPATGAFAKSGSFLGFVDHASYIEVKNGKYTIYHKDPKYPSRSTLKDIPVKQAIAEWDINAHLDAIMHEHNTNQDFEL